MPLARAPMLFVTVAQEKRDFKIFVILITAWSRVQILPGPPKRTCKRWFARPFLFFGVIRAVDGSVESFAHLAADGILPLLVNLRVDGKGCAWLRVPGLCRNRCHADVRVGKQNADKCVAEHMRVNLADTGTLRHTVDDFSVVAGIDGPAKIIDDNKIPAAQLFKGFPVVLPFAVHAVLPRAAHALLLPQPFFPIGFHVLHKFGRYIYVTDIVLFRGCKVIRSA